MALVSLDPARCLAWAEPRHGLVIFSGARAPATVKKGSLCSAPADQPLIVTASVGVHMISHPVIAGLVAWIVYDFVGLAVLRRSWVNLDLIWCFSLLGAAAVLFFAPLA